MDAESRALDRLGRVFRAGARQGLGHAAGVASCSKAVLPCCPTPRALNVFLSPRTTVLPQDRQLAEQQQSAEAQMQERVVR